MVRRVLLMASPGAPSSLRQQLNQLGCHVQVVHELRHIPSLASPGQPVSIILPAIPGREDLSRQLKLHRLTNAFPLVQVLHDELPLGLRVEPEAVVRVPVTPEFLASALDRAFSRHAERLREGTIDELDLTLPSDPLELGSLGEILATWLSNCGLGSFQAQQFESAVREVVANAIEWGHAYERSRLVWVQCRLDAEKVSVLVRDSGPGFDPGNLPHAARPGDPVSHLEVRSRLELREGGYGILMASGQVDHLCYSVSGNEGLLIKYLPVRSGRAAECVS